MTSLNKPNEEARDIILHENVVIIHEVIFKTKPEYLQVWYEVIKYRHNSVSDERFTFSFGERKRRTTRGQATVLCSTFKIHFADTDESVKRKLLTIQIYHTNQKNPDMRTIHIQGKWYDDTWIRDEIAHLKDAVTNIHKEGITETKKIQEYLKNNMPAMVLPDELSDLAKKAAGLQVSKDGEKK